MWDRSQCLTCGHTLRWYELIPIVSFIVQLGRCRVCQSKISLQYPLIEAAAGGLSLTAVWIAGVTVEAVLLAVIFFLFVLIFVYDLKHTIIPNPWVYKALLIALVLVFIRGNSVVVVNAAPYVFTAAGIFSFFFGLWYFTGGRSMGLGDGKLAAAVGLLLSPIQAVSAIVLSFWIGAGVSLLWMAHQQITQSEETMTMKTQIPFGPFIILGYLLVAVFEISLF